MKKIYFTLLLQLMGLCAFSQNINKVEYFIDADPGYGAGVDVPVTAANIVSTSFSVALNSASDGFHMLSIRAKDDANNWSIVGIRPFYKETLGAGSAVPNIVAMEYFIDTDPGYGAGTSIGFTAGPTVNTSFSVSLPNTVADGFHFLSIRAKDVNNQWSVVGIRPFYKETFGIGNSIPNITQMEYFIDADPGYGLGVEVPITPNTEKKPSIYADVSALTAGTHRMSIRAKDENGRWSIVGIKDFVVSTQFTKINSLPTEYCRNTPFNIPFTAVGTYNAGNIFTAQLSNNTGSFASPVSLGTSSSTVSGNILATIPNSVTLGAGYKVRILASNGAGTTDYNLSDIAVTSTCTIQILTGNPNILPDAVFCTGGTISVPFTTLGTFGVGNVFSLQISDLNSANFVNMPSIVNGNTITGAIPDGLPSGDSYRIRVMASNPGIIGKEATASLRIRNSDQETVLSQISGGWYDPAVWSCSRIPVSQRVVDITSGQTVTVPNDGSAQAGTLILNGSLNFEATNIGNSSISLAKIGSTLAGGTLQIANDFTVNNTGSIIAKIYSGVEYDKIVVADATSLNGTLTVLLANGYVPTDGHSFAIVSYGSLSGTFNQINLPLLSGNLIWETKYNATGLVLTIKNFKASDDINLSISTGCITTINNLGNTNIINNPPYNTISNNAPSSFPLGSTIVTWSATDLTGVTKFASQTITIINNCTSMQALSIGGAWNAESTWNCCRIPGLGDTVTIPAGSTITIPFGFTARALKVIVETGGTILNQGGICLNCP